MEWFFSSPFRCGPAASSAPVPPSSLFLPRPPDDDDAAVVAVDVPGGVSGGGGRGGLRAFDAAGACGGGGGRGGARGRRRAGGRLGRAGRCRCLRRGPLRWLRAGRPLGAGRRLFLDRDAPVGAGGRGTVCRRLGRRLRRLRGRRWL